jgi:hypothetical protein
VVSCGYETWFLALKEVHRLKIFENRVLRRIFGPKRDEKIEVGENFITQSLIISAPYHI